MGEYQLAQIQDMKFAPTAQLFLTDVGEEENAKGIGSISRQYRLTAALEHGHWRMTFRADDGKTGTLALPVPTTMTGFSADIHDGKKSSGNGPLLYKEWRFEGAPEGDGIFQEGFTTPARFTLVFQGRGNRCDNGGDFTYWRLSVSGDHASYAFFGKLAAAVP